MLFLDVIKAFASVFRQLIMSPDTSDEAFREALLKAGMDRDFADEILQELRITSVWPEKDQILGESLCSFHEGSGFSTEGLSNVVETRAGGLAGPSLGDALFTLAIKRILTRLKNELADEILEEEVEEPHNIISMVESNKGKEVCNSLVQVLSEDVNGSRLRWEETSFVDDLAMPIFVENTTEVIP